MVGADSQIGGINGYMAGMNEARMP
jgi:hypothetical protein